jgi:hypothetical protein
MRFDVGHRMDNEKNSTLVVAAATGITSSDASVVSGNASLPTPANTSISISVVGSNITIIERMPNDNG